MRLTEQLSALNSSHSHLQTHTHSHTNTYTYTYSNMADAIASQDTMKKKRFPETDHEQSPASATYILVDSLLLHPLCS